MLNAILFYSFAVLVLGGAILTITRRSAVHSAISLIVSLMGVAGLYLLQQAEFLFAVQIVLYIGGIMVLFLFVIMLVNLDEAGQGAPVQRPVAGRNSLRGAGGRAGAVRDVEGRGIVSGAPGRDAAGRRQRQHRSAGRRAVFAHTCCLSKSPPCCCWWRWSARW